ncbi:MAG: hypothetical protein FJ008_01615 [Chloroflexi bacterium]|nr:hypothetical protein [Chloroflexota bacterium]MBM3172761.1 hypothetical protein [Chloroflexota bacterium]MBM3174913.1 hypothetical protein [Chloroflexota bacterium]MBM4449692.1 hypothetical protein [Chloroflexota bacterium]
MVTAVKGVKELIDEVVKPGLCTLCGACVGDCPYLVFYNGKIKLLDLCTRAEGHCYEYCPRTYTNMDAISQNIFNKTYDASELGHYIDIFISRASDVKTRNKAQYGGTVSALLSLALSEGLIDKALLAKSGKDRRPTGIEALNGEDVLSGSGSNYMAYPALQRLNRLQRDSRENIGIVLTPCQCIALSKMLAYPATQRFDTSNVKLAIGLFCTWALSYDRFFEFLNEKVNVAKIKKFDIPPPPANRFDIYTRADRISFPLDTVREYRMSTCSYCLDMTAEFADISVGAAEGIEGWNTVIIRTQRGSEIINLARHKGKLDVDSIPQQNLDHLKESAMLKKTRATNEIIKRTSAKNDLMYLGISENTRGKLLAERR